MQSLQPESSHRQEWAELLCQQVQTEGMGRCALNQLSKSICKMGELESQHMGMRKLMDSLSSGEETKAHRADGKGNRSLNASFVYVP